MSGPAESEDPYGDKAWLEQQRQQRVSKGRDAILGADRFEDWERGGSEPGAGDDDGDDPTDRSDEGSPDDRPARKYKGLRHAYLTDDGDVAYRTLGPVDEGCPVTPLGRDGKVFFFLTKKGQLVSYEDGKFGQAHLEALFADELWWLMRSYPAFNQGGTLTGFKADLARKALFASCARPGMDIFDPREKVRGLGCWRGDNGELIQHLGNEVRIGDAAKGHRPGLIGDYVYPGRPKLEPPLMAEDGADRAALLLHDFGTWNWSRPDLDPRLLLGWLGCAILGAALEWRPAIFITGDAGTGKSTLQEWLRKLLPGWLVSTVDASPAALRQIVNQDSKAVAFDEIEADGNNPHSPEVIKLARIAGSGGEVHRGGSDHKASEFKLRGCFAFSAIVPPSMRPADMQRMAFLRLMPLSKGARLKGVSDAELKALGQHLVGRVVKGWPRWAETLRVYEDALQSDELGHNQRGARQFGTLLAAADLILHEEAPTLEVATSIARGLERHGLYEYETSEPMWLKIVRHILTAQPMVWGSSSGYPSVAERVREWIKATDAVERTRLQRLLNRAGLAVVRNRAGHVFLAVPLAHQQVQAMFKDTDYRAQGGDGAWTSALRNADRYQPVGNGEAVGVWRSEKVPQLNRATCTHVWLGAKVEIGGKVVPIFDEDPDQGDAGGEIEA